MLNSQQTVANVVLDHSECAEVFQRHRIDFCCRGDVTVEAAARTRGVDVDALLIELSHAIAERQPGRQQDPRAMSTAQLVAHIVSKHHAYLRKALPMVQQLAAKVGRVHGERNPKLRDLADVVDELAETLLAHLDDEEEALFPALMARGRNDAAAAALLASMVEEHLAVARLFERIRAASDDFAIPEWACNSYRTLFSELAQIEADTLIHVHLENHVLKPRFVAENVQPVRPT